MAQQLCFACFGANLAVVNGVLVCEDCGTQCQAQVEESEYGEVGGSNATRRRAAGSFKGPPRAAFVEAEGLDPQDAAQRVRLQGRAYLRCLQLLMQAQAEALVTTFQLPPEVGHLVRHIWLSLLPHLRCLDFQFSKTDDVDAELGADSGNASEEDGEDGAERAKKPRRTRFLISGQTTARQTLLSQRAGSEAARRALGQEALDKKLVDAASSAGAMAMALGADISPLTTLSICLLACIILRQPITPFDILRWALDGQLPFLDAAARCSHVLRALDPQVAAPLHSLLRPSGGGTGAAGLLVSAVELSGLLGLQLPNLNGPLLLYKAARELALPEEVFLVARELHDMLLQDTPLLSPLFITALHHPYSILMSALATAAWLCYGLDGAEGNAAHFGTLPPPPQHQPSGLQGAPHHHQPQPPQQQQPQQPQPQQQQDAHAARAPVDGGVLLPPDAPGPGGGGEGGAHAHAHAALPPSRAAMMRRAVELQRHHHQPPAQGAGRAAQPPQGGAGAQPQGQQGEELPEGKLARDAIEAQEAMEAGVAARTASILSSGWLQWAQARMREHARPHSHPATVEEACQLRGAELAAYLRYCKDTVFAGGQLPQGLADIDEFLQAQAHPAMAASSPGLHAHAAGAPAPGGAGDGAEPPRTHSQPHKYTAAPGYVLSSEAHHPDVLAVAAACGALVHVHPDIILRQMAALEKKVAAIERQAAAIERQEAGSA